ncbi:MAG: hypothetical protein ACR2J8_16085, partial [Thermomicrobiales bacterium]
MSRRWLTLAPTAVVAVAVLAACGSPKPVEREDVERVTGVLNAPVVEATPEVAAGGAEISDDVTITSYDIYFEPKEVKVPADTDVK